MPVTVYTKGGMPLLVDGKLAISDKCCCQEENCVSSTLRLRVAFKLNNYCAYNVMSCEHDVSEATVVVTSGTCTYEASVGIRRASDGNGGWLIVVGGSSFTDYALSGYRSLSIKVPSDSPGTSIKVKVTLPGLASVERTLTSDSGTLYTWLDSRDSPSAEITDGPTHIIDFAVRVCCLEDDLEMKSAILSGQHLRVSVSCGGHSAVLQPDDEYSSRTDNFTVVGTKTLYYRIYRARLCRTDIGAAKNTQYAVNVESTTGLSLMYSTMSVNPATVYCSHEGTVVFDDDCTATASPYVVVVNKDRYEICTVDMVVQGGAVSCPDDYPLYDISDERISCGLECSFDSDDDGIYDQSGTLGLTAYYDCSNGAWISERQCIILNTGSEFKASGRHDFTDDRAHEDRVPREFWVGLCDDQYGSISVSKTGSAITVVASAYVYELVVDISMTLVVAEDSKRGSSSYVSLVVYDEFQNEYATGEVSLNNGGSTTRNFSYTLGYASGVACYDDGGFADEYRVYVIGEYGGDGEVFEYITGAEITVNVLKSVDGADSSINISESGSLVRRLRGDGGAVPINRH